MQCVLYSALVLACFSNGALSSTLDLDLGASPLEKVVTLLSEMKAQVEKEASADEEAHGKYQCWCDTNMAEKTEATKAAEAKINELTTFIQGAEALKAQLTTEIANLEQDIADDQDSLAKATSIRNQEKESYDTEKADMEETITLLKQAVDILAKVQLLQHDHHGKAKALLMQLQSSVRSIHDRLPAFQSVMQKDLWDVMGSLDTALGGRSFLRKQAMSALAVSDSPGGAAKGAKSYNSRSGGIFGILSAQKDDFEKKLATATKEEGAALAEYEALKSAKNGEIAAATKQKKDKAQQLAETDAKKAQAAEDVQATMDALDADQRFLVEITASCAESKDEYAKRTSVRSQELQALSEALGILREDESRDLFGKTMSFVQTAKHQAAEKETQAVTAAVKHLMGVAHHNKDTLLEMLAVRMQLDKFTKVKELMDKMTAELKKQQVAEDEKIEACNKNIDETEDSQKVKQQEREDLESSAQNLANSIQTLQNEIKDLEAQNAELKVNLKAAGENRKAENKEFQQVVSDQRATINILNKVEARLKQFYSQAGASLAQVRSGQPGRPNRQAPKEMTYEKNAGAGGVLQVLAMIITDAGEEEAVITSDEQAAQKRYAKFAAQTTASVDANNAAIAEKSKHLSTAQGDAATVKQALTANGESLADGAKVLADYHSDCDWIVKYHGARKQARAEEMQAIADAKAILSGADFGGDDAADEA